MLRRLLHNDWPRALGTPGGGASILSAEIDVRMIRLGGMTLFQHEPEGVVLAARSHRPFAILYECKSRRDTYRMSSDDTLRYCDYIRRKKHEVRIRYNLELTRFVIVAPSFAGNLDHRIAQIEGEGVVVSFVPSEMIVAASDCLQRMEFTDIQLLDLEKMFVRGVVAEPHIQAAFG